MFLQWFAVLIFFSPLWFSGSPLWIQSGGSKVEVGVRAEVRGPVTPQRDVHVELWRHRSKVTWWDSHWCFFDRPPFILSSVAPKWKFSEILTKSLINFEGFSLLAIFFYLQVIGRNCIPNALSLFLLQRRLSPGLMRSVSLTAQLLGDWPQTRTALPPRMMRRMMMIVKMEGSGGRFFSRLCLHMPLTQVLMAHLRLVYTSE